MKQVFDKSNFDNIKESLNNNFDLHVEFPGKIFKNSQYYIFLEFDAFCLEKFYKSFVNIAGPSFFYTLNPDPEKFYYHYFERYNVFTFSDSNSFSEYITLLNKQPEEGVAGAIIDVVDSMVISSFKSIVSVYGNRDLGCLVVGFLNQNDKKKFTEAYGFNHIFSVEDAIEELLPGNYKYLDSVKLNYGNIT